MFCAQGMCIPQYKYLRIPLVPENFPNQLVSYSIS